jgi:hypothetical protein
MPGVSTLAGCRQQASAPAATSSSYNLLFVHPIIISLSELSQALSKLAIIYM